MTESDIYQIVGEAYCTGLSEGMRKQASSNTGMDKKAGDVPAVPLILGASGLGALGGLLQSATNGKRDYLSNAVNKAEKGVQMGLTSSLGFEVGEKLGKVLQTILQHKYFNARDSIPNFSEQTGLIGSVLGGLGGYFLPTFSKNPFDKGSEKKASLEKKALSPETLGDALNSAASRGSVNRAIDLVGRIRRRYAGINEALRNGGASVSSILGKDAVDNLRGGWDKLWNKTRDLTNLYMNTKLIREEDHDDILKRGWERAGNVGTTYAKSILGKLFAKANP